MNSIANFNMRPGIALSAAQMAQLTSDSVWLVEREVTLADGTKVKALVPQLYVKVKDGDLTGDGALISASATSLNLSGDVLNSGTIAGRTAVVLMEREFQQALKDGKTVNLKIDVGYPAGTGVRPSEFFVTGNIDGIPFRKEFKQ